MNDKPTLWKRIRRKPLAEPEPETMVLAVPDIQGEVRPLDIPTNDPLLAFVLLPAIPL